MVNREKRPFSTLAFPLLPAPIIDGLNVTIPRSVQLTIGLASRKLVVRRCLTIPPPNEEGASCGERVKGKERITGPCTAPSNAHSILPKPLIIDRDYCVSSATRPFLNPRYFTLPSISNLFSFLFFPFLLPSSCARSNDRP